MPPDAVCENSYIALKDFIHHAAEDEKRMVCAKCIVGL